MPSARVIARSVRTFAGSWTANGLRHGANAADSSRPRPVVVMVWVSSTPPACPTAPDALVSTFTWG